MSGKKDTLIAKSKTFCAGCRDNYYNGDNSTTGECWSYKFAKVKKKWVIGWFTPQDRKENFHREITLDCHNEPGSKGYYDELPKHLRR